MSSRGYKTHQIHSLYDIISYILFQVLTRWRSISPETWSQGLWPRRTWRNSCGAAASPVIYLIIEIWWWEFKPWACCFIMKFLVTRPPDSHVPAPLAPEVISQAVDLPLPPSPVVLEANIDIESIPSIGTKSAKSKLPKWLKLAQSECDLPKFTTWLMLLFQKNKLLRVFDLRKCTMYYT